MKVNIHNYNGKFMNITTFMIIRRLEVERWDIVIWVNIM